MSATVFTSATAGPRCARSRSPAPFAADEPPNLLYTDEMIAEDFPGGLAVHPAAAFAVAQLSDLVGEGERTKKGFAG
ncbi:MAG: hypothetical protein VX640_04130 [Pseudomonadota bacterium]|nr:hypothetical protein [Pseudomonadota bacterium]